MNWSPHTVLVTGGTSGIGRALATQLLAAGATVIITGRSAERLAAVQRELPGLHTLVCDQRDPASIARAAHELLQSHPRLDTLINNAGVGRHLDLQDPALGAHALEDEIRSNLIGPIQWVGHLLPHLLRQPQARIVNVSSGLAFVPMPLKPVYCATKAGLHSYTQSLRVQLARSRVRVIELVPPATDTPFNAGQEAMNTAWLMSADALARAALRGIARGRSEILPGMSPLLRWAGRLMPGAVIRRGDAEHLAGTRGARAPGLPSTDPSVR